MAQTPKPCSLQATKAPAKSAVVSTPCAHHHAARRPQAMQPLQLCGVERSLWHGRQLHARVAGSTQQSRQVDLLARLHMLLLRGRATAGGLSGQQLSQQRVLLRLLRLLAGLGVLHAGGHARLGRQHARRAILHARPARRAVLHAGRRRAVLHARGHRAHVLHAVRREGRPRRRRAHVHAWWHHARRQLPSIARHARVWRAGLARAVRRWHGPGRELHAWGQRAALLRRRQLSGGWRRRLGLAQHVIIQALQTR